MNSFTLTAVGQLARNPELVAKGDVIYTRFCLVGTDYAGKDEIGMPREIVTSLWFVAFGGLGEAIARNSRKGDQLILDARVRANIWTDKQGEKQYDHDFVVQGFRFGAPGRAKREELGGRDWGARRDGEADGHTDGVDTLIESRVGGEQVRTAALVSVPEPKAAGVPDTAVAVTVGESDSGANDGDKVTGEKPTTERASQRELNKAEPRSAADKTARGGRKTHAAAH